MPTTISGRTIRIEGPADESARTALRSHVDDVVNGDVVVDLGAVTRLDSLTVEVLAASATRLAARGDALVVLGAAEVLDRALRLGLGDLLSVERT